jgi:hypothetical protein
MVYRKKVLISPSDSKTGLRFKNTICKSYAGKIKKQSDIETDKPVSEQQEELIRGYYSWPGYYGNGMYGHMGLGVGISIS